VDPSGKIYGSEIGLLQLSPTSRERFNLTEEQAMDPKTNLKYSLKIWDNWANKLFDSAEQKPNRTERDVWSWLVTSVGPGATRKLRELNGGYGLRNLQRLISNEDILNAHKKSFGTQSPKLINARIRKALEVARRAK
jgi:hypothetical protein